MKPLLVLLLASVAGTAAPSLVHAQDGPTLIRQGTRAFEDDFDVPRAITLLRRGVNPGAGPQDVLWAQGVQLLAQLLFDEGDEAQASLWARWSMRIQPGMAIDSLNLVSEVIDAFGAARAQAIPGPGDAVTTTSWTWPAGDLTAATGRIQVRAPAIQVPLNVLVVGRGLVPTTQGISVPAGTYELRASASGYAAATVTREVLPGVTTILTFSLRPIAIAGADSILGGDVASAALARLVRLTVNRFGVDPTCATGFLVGNGLVATTYTAIRSGDSIAAELPDGRAVDGDIRIASYDVAANLAVLSLEETQTDSLPLATDVRDGQYTWALSYPSCREDGAAARNRVTSWRNRPRGTLALGTSLQWAEQGGPLIDGSGAVVGLAASGDSAVPIAVAAGTFANARRAVRGQSTLTAGQVARRESHIYGVAEITSQLAGAIATITPLEDWQWPETQRAGLLPITFVGPMGEYALDLQHQGAMVESSRFTVRPAETTRVMVGGQAVAAADIAPPKKGGGLPIPLILLGVAAAAGGLVFALAGGGGGGGGGNGNGIPTDPGAITISLPHP